MRVIEAKHEQFSRSYREQTLPPVFVQGDGDTKPLCCDWLAPTCDNELLEFIKQAKQTLIIAADCLPETWVQSIQNAVDEKGLRVYLCLGCKDANQGVIDQLDQRCRVRSGLAQQGMLLLRDINSLHKAGSIVLTGYVLALDKQKIDDSYRSFCKIFWHEAKLDHFDGTSEPVEALDHQIITNHSYQLPGGLQAYNNQRPVDLLCQTSVPRGIESTADKFSLALTSVENASLNQSLVEAGARIALTEQSLPYIAQSAGSIWILPEAANVECVNWGIKLSEQQTAELEGVTTEAQRSARWQLRRDANINSLVGKHILFADSTDNPVVFCELEKNIVLADVYCSELEEFLKKSAEALTTGQTGWSKNALAGNIDYRVRVHPPYLPADAEQDSLINSWRKSENGWQEQVAGLRARVEKLKKKHEGLKKKPFQKIIEGFLLGQKQSFKAMLAQLLELENWRVSLATPAERVENKTKLLDITQQIEALTQRADMEENRAVNELQWQEKKATLNQCLNDAAAGLDRARESYDQQRDKLEERKCEAIAACEQELVSALEQLDSKDVSTLRQPLLYIDACERLQGKKAKKQWPTLKEVIDRYRPEVTDYEREIKALSDKLQQTEKQHALALQGLSDHGEQFNYQASSNCELDRQLGNKSLAGPSIDWPSEELPSNDLQLYTQAQQRYLVVEYHEQLEQAEQDADRLNAELCVKGRKYA